MKEVSRLPDALAACGGLACAIAVGLGAFAMHASVSTHDQLRLGIAALFLFLHGLALAALAATAGSRLQQAGLLMLLVGTVLFSGSLVGAAIFGVAPRLAPFGGSATILGWLLVAAGFASARRDRC